MEGKLKANVTNPIPYTWEATFDSYFNIYNYLDICLCQENCRAVTNWVTALVAF